MNPNLRRLLSRTEQGKYFERRACGHLTAHGLQLIARNFRCSLGEIDLVMRDGDCLVFVEVRYRRSPNFGGALESIDGRKRMRLARAAQIYLQQQPHGGAARFDVVAIDRDSIDWRKNAFDMPGA